MRIVVISTSLNSASKSGRLAEFCVRALMLPESAPSFWTYARPHFRFATARPFGILRRFRSFKEKFVRLMESSSPRRSTTGPWQLPPRI